MFHIFKMIFRTDTRNDINYFITLFPFPVLGSNGIELGGIKVECRTTGRGNCCTRCQCKLRSLLRQVGIGFNHQGYLIVVNNRFAS